MTTFSRKQSLAEPRLKANMETTAEEIREKIHEWALGQLPDDEVVKDKNAKVLETKPGEMKTIDLPRLWKPFAMVSPPTSLCKFTLLANLVFSTCKFMRTCKFMCKLLCIFLCKFGSML